MLLVKAKEAGAAHLKALNCTAPGAPARSTAAEGQLNMELVPLLTFPWVVQAMVKPLFLEQAAEKCNDAE